MSLKEFIKNPSAFIWDYLDKKSGKNLDTNLSDSTISNSNSKVSLGSALESDSDSKLEEVTQFVEQAKQKDWLWLFKGRTGLFIGLSVFVVIFLMLIEPYIVPKNRPTVTEPDVVDSGDDLDKPDFQSVGYINGALYDSNFLVYSPDINQINEIGTRGIVLNSINTETINRFYFPVTKDTYIYLKGTTLFIHYLNKFLVKELGVEKEIVEEKTDPIFLSIGSIENIQNMHKTVDGNVAFTLVSTVDNIDTNIGTGDTAPVEQQITSSTKTLFVYSSTGKKIHEYNIDRTDTDLYTYLDGETYFIQQLAESYFLKKLNSNNEEILSLPLGSYKPHRIYITSDNRFLILFEQPSRDSYFYVRMIDSTGNTFFNFTPKETIQPLLEVSNIVYDAEDNQVFVVGTKVAKLFNINGEQLWIR